MAVAVFLLLNEQIFPSLNINDIILSEVLEYVLLLFKSKELENVNCFLILIPVSLEGFHRIGKKLIKKKVSVELFFWQIRPPEVRSSSGCLLFL